uniref:Uncharacterized protein n=1 Tax=Opuntia streptacantha TaxID=393608 RepID=A0A7C8YLT0_OPUST
MGSKDRSGHWSVFDSLKFLPASPDALMAEINAAIAALEYARASAIHNPPPSPSKDKSLDQKGGSFYDAQIAEEAYKLGCEALSEGKVDEGLQSLSISLSKCPPDQTDAVAKIQALMSLLGQQIRN